MDRFNEENSLLLWNIHQENFPQTHYSTVPMVREANDVLFRRDFFIAKIMDIMVLKNSSGDDP